MLDPRHADLDPRMAELWKRKRELEALLTTASKGHQKLMRSEIRRIESEILLRQDEPWPDEPNGEVNK